MTGQTIEMEAGAERHWLLAADAHPEIDRLAEVECAQFLGSVALGGQVEVNTVPETNNEATLMAAINHARYGNPEARKTIEANVMTDMAERMFKAGHLTRVQLEMIGGVLSQNGRALVDISKNSFQHLILNQEMKLRTSYEMKNALLFQKLADAGVFKNYNALVFSPTPTDTKTKQDYGFFADTDTCSIQMLSQAGDQLLLETALVAGKKRPDAPRHDFKAIHQLAAENGVELIPDDATEMIKYVMLIPKESVPHGISDIVRQYDRAAGGTFYGEAKAAQDYELHAVECQRRNDSFSDIVQRITDQLIRESNAFGSPIDAIKRLDQLSERLCVDYAVTTNEVSALVFGSEAANFIEEARRLHESGDIHARDQAILSAKQTANSNSCPIFQGLLEGGGDEDGGDNANESQGSKWMSCPYCSARVYDDPCAKVLSCWDCKAAVVNGVVVSKGNGGSKKREAEKRAKAEAEMAAQVDAAFEEAGIKTMEAEPASV